MSPPAGSRSSGATAAATLTMAAIRVPLKNIVLLCCSIITCSGCMISYLTRASIEELGILAKRRSIAKILAQHKAQANSQEEFSEEDLAKLSLTQEVRAYIQMRGLDPGGSFTSYARLDRPAVSYVVMAAPRTELRYVTWWFPVVGSVPYKGFFTQEDAEDEARSLQAQGFETIVRPVEAFSTLGWFNDPLLTPMLKRSPVGLTNLIIHESVHANLWVPGAADFNESLANFVAATETTKFFRQSQGRYAAWLPQAEWEEVHDFLASNFIADLTTRLRALYASYQAAGEEVSPAALERDRERLLAEALRPFPTSLTSALRLTRINNPQVLNLALYLSHLADFQEVYKACEGNLHSFLNHLRILVERARHDHQPPFSLLEEDAKKRVCHIDS